MLTLSDDWLISHTYTEYVSVSIRVLLFIIIIIIIKLCIDYMDTKFVLRTGSRKIDDCAAVVYGKGNYIY